MTEDKHENNKAINGFNSPFMLEKIGVYDEKQSQIRSLKLPKTPEEK